MPTTQRTIDHFPIDERIERMFVEMKDTSELMIDLAYSSLIYDNKDIAREIYDLEDYIDDLNRTIQRLSINSALRNEDVDRALAIIRICGCFEAFADAAREIADVVLRDVDPHPIIRESIRESDVIISSIDIFPGSILVDRTLGEKRVATNSGMWVFAIKREKGWIFGADENTRLKAGDVLFARGPEDGEEVLKGVASGNRKEF